MLADFVKHVAKETGMTQKRARPALGAVLSAAGRCDAALAGAVFERYPGARTLSEKAGAESGAPVGEIARLIEATPGGAAYVVEKMIKDLHRQGLGHAEIGALFPAIESYGRDQFGVDGLGTLGSVFGSPDATPMGVKGVA
jgi:hypothetical protein